MKKRKILIPIIVAVAVIAIVVSVSSVIAYMFRKSPELTNNFVPAEVNCNVVETFADNKKTSVMVENTGNVKAYIRMRVVTLWQDSKGNPVGRTSPAIKFGSDWKYDAANWIYDPKEMTFYHKSPVEVGQTTKDLLKLEGSFEGIKLNAVTETYDGVNYTYHPTIVFISEAIQSAPDDAVTKWDVTLDSNGNISGLK